MPRPQRAIARAAAVLAPVLLVCTFTPAQSQNLDDPTRGDMVLFPGPLVELELPGSPPQPGEGPISRPKVQGWNMPGNSFRASDGWWRLACATGCRLSPSRMTVTPAKHDVYDSDPVPSQILSWSTSPSEPAEHRRSSASPGRTPLVLAVFKPIRTLSGLKLVPGPVTTWLHQGMASYPAGGRVGTMEVAIPLAAGQQALLVPRLRPAAVGPSGAEQPATLHLELRVGTQRQWLDEFDTSGIEGLVPVAPTSYLMWAGDLDGDGKLDLLVDFSGSNSRKAVLFLSTLATGKELVGRAGSFEFFDPSSAGC